MFKKPLADLKTSAPLKNSDRKKKLRQRVLQEFLGSPESTEVGDILVPEGLQSVKFMTHRGEPGLAYTSADGEPLWFSLGKGNDVLIPTVYTLWKKPRLLPHLSTPSAVIPILQNGADLMAAGVVEMLGNPGEGQLVSITQYAQGAVGPPLAVGRMAMPGERVREKDAKGKVVKVIHVFKDKLWEMGGKGEPPEPEPLPATGMEDDRSEEVRESGEPLNDGDKSEANEGGKKEELEAATPPPPTPSEPELVEEDAAPPPLSPQDVSSILRTALIQAIFTSLAALPQASFPLPSTLLYTNHILPARPAHLASVSSYSSSTSLSGTTTTTIDIKHSAAKNLTAFLKGAEKEGLLRIKELRGKGANGGSDVQILSVNTEHPGVQAHVVYKTIGEVEAKKEKRQEREREEREKTKEMVVVELWKPHQQSVRLFEEIEKDSTALYTHQELKETVNAYISAKSIVNSNQRQFVNLDDLLRDVLSGKGSHAEVPAFMKREDILRRLTEKMQPWHRIEVEGKDPVLKKGKLHPISLTIKIRQGRKACTLITNFEPYQLDAETLAEELRRICASSTAVNPLPGKQAGLEVMVQGKQIKAIRELLIGKGVPKAWIEESDQTAGKK